MKSYIGLFISFVFSKGGNDMERVLRRLKFLEDAQKATVESCLEEVKNYVKTPLFLKDRALDMLVNLKVIAKESGHAKCGFFDAVLKAMRERLSVAPEQFKKYLEVLLGDKDHEKVLDAIAKVDKAGRVASQGSRTGFRSNPYPRMGRGYQSYQSRASVECYNCRRLGHYQAQCPLRAGRRAPGFKREERERKAN